MKLAIVYHSAGGNTKALAEIIHSYLPGAEIYRLADFSFEQIDEYDGLLVGTYTWGSGDIPAKMLSFYRELEGRDISHLTTGVFGTGETNYKHFCNAVNHFRDMLYANSNLAVVLKVEQMYQTTDLKRIKKFAELFQNKVRNSV